MNGERPHIFSMSLPELREWCRGRGMPEYRAAQILEWVYEKGVADAALMTNLSKRDRAVVGEGLAFFTGEVVGHQTATDGTEKLLIRWEGNGGGAPRGVAAENGAAVGGRAGVALPQGVDGAGGAGARESECVMIPVDAPERGAFRRTACVSSQVGCPVGCRFCASGIGGLEGNLSAGRIVEQVWRLGALLREGGDGVGRITHVVFMGMGEPLANLSNVVRAVRTLATLPPGGMGISARRITISTVGLPRAIERLAEELELPVTLALSLHAPNDELRRELIPWAEYTTIGELLGACVKWFEKTGREITLEYTLLRGVNDRAEHAEELAALVPRLRGSVNLIRYNEVAGLPFRRPRDEDVREFQRILRERGVNVHIRASRGRDISAACGQLRHERAGRGG